MGLAVSFYAGSRELFEKIVQVPGSYDRVFRGVQYAVSKKIRVRLKTPIISSNLCTLDKMKEFAKELNLVYRYTPIITPKDDGSKENLENRLTDEELKSFLRGEKMENLYRDPVDIRAPVCTAARSQVAVSPTGEVYPCIQIRKSAGNIRNKPFSELWKSDIFKPYRTLTMADIEKCSVCDLQGYCSPCMGLAEIEHGSITIPPSEYCRLAAIKKEIYNEKKNEESS
jgi:radical SAM protein with 4Fe4S-binding SPASM domain